MEAMAQQSQLNTAVGVQAILGRSSSGNIAVSGKSNDRASPLGPRTRRRGGGIADKGVQVLLHTCVLWLDGAPQDSAERASIEWAMTVLAVSQLAGPWRDPVHFLPHTPPHAVCFVPFRRTQVIPCDPSITPLFCSGCHS